MKFFIILVFLVVASRIVFAEDCACIGKAEQTYKDQDLQFESARCQLASDLSKCRNQQAGLRTMTTLAEKNYPKAQYILGYWYMIGRIGPKVNYEKAFNLFTKASDNNIIPAYHDLGWLYETGNGTKIDLKIAEELYTKADAAGDIRGKLGLKRVELARLKLQYPHPDKKKKERP